MQDWLTLGVDAAVGLAGLVNACILGRARRGGRTEITIVVRALPSPAAAPGAGRRPAKG